MFPRPTAAPIMAKINAIDESHCAFCSLILLFKLLLTYIIAMNVFDKFLMGETTGINWCFENKHFLKRLSDNGIKREYIVDCLMEEEPISWEHVEADKYAVVYEAPLNKDYKEIRILMACSNNSIDLVTVMRNNETTTTRQNRQYQSDKKKNLEKKRLKALSKRKW